MRALLLGLLCCSAAWAQPEVITAGGLREHVRYLADDMLQGRGTGTPGGRLAEQYIAGQFARYGLLPAGDAGSYFQEVPLVGLTTLDSTRAWLGTPRTRRWELKRLAEYTVTSPTGQTAVSLDAPLVFVGFGISAPEYGWDDYKGLDLRGKVALVLAGEPSTGFKGRALTYYGRWTYKFEETARRGALATLIVHREDLASYGWHVVRNSSSGERSQLREDGQPRLQAACWLQWPVASRLLQECGQSLPALFQRAQTSDFRPLPLAARFGCQVKTRVRPFTARNVLACRPGGKRPHEAVLYSAHHDHLGIRPGSGQDRIYNGAVDNASGCGVLLELARAYAGVQADRSLYFVATTAEEQGLLGATYLALHPPVPVNQISLDLNFDCLPALGEPLDVTVNGAERTTFWDTVKQTASESGLEIQPEAHPEFGWYYRMDHFSLAQRGIPAFSINEGVRFQGRDVEWGIAQQRDYVKNRYHQPSDEFRPEWDFSGLVKFTRFAFRLGWKAANQPELIQWKSGDEFERIRVTPTGRRVLPAGPAHSPS